MTTSQAPAVPVDDLPRLSRRSALLGAVALLAPLGPTVAFARARPTPPPPGTILLNGNENPYGPSPSARQAIIAGDRKSTRLNSSHWITSRMPSSA